MNSTQSERPDYTSEQIEDGLRSALRAGDMKSAASILHLLAVKDPQRAQLWLDAVELV